MFTLNSTLYARKPFGEYQIKLATNKEDADYVKRNLEPGNPWSPLKINGNVIEGVYVNPAKNSAIVRMLITDGEYAGSPVFTEYMSEIDMNSVIKTIMELQGVNKIDVTNALAYWHDNAITFYHYNELGKDRDGNPKLYEKWRTYKSATATEETDITKVIAESAEDDL